MRGDGFAGYLDTLYSRVNADRSAHFMPQTPASETRLSLASERVTHSHSEF
jgi:hypothetical protein